MQYRKSGSIIFAVALAFVGAVSVQAEDLPAGAPARVQVSDDGPVLVTPAGMTLYMYGNDGGTMGRVACTMDPPKSWTDQQAGLGQVPVKRADVQRSCAQLQPPYLAAAGAQPVGEFALIDRPEGGKQWTYRGHPLYTSIRDTKPGERNGAGLTGGAGGGGGGGGGRNRGWRIATTLSDLPVGLRTAYRDDGLTLFTSDLRPVYTPKNASEKLDTEFQPIPAPAATDVQGEWSVVNGGSGFRQYAFRGKPLFVPPAGMTDDEIAEAGGWQRVVMYKNPGRPAAIGTRLTLLGEAFTTKTGRSLYIFNCTVQGSDLPCDQPGDAAGYWVAVCGSPQECAKRWHPYLADKGAKPVGQWSVVDVAYPAFTEYLGLTYPPEAPRVKAWAYRGRPVYTYYEDERPGDIEGDAITTQMGSHFSLLVLPGRSINDLY